MPRANRSVQPVADPRDAAYRHLAAHARRYPDLIPSEINTGTLDPRDSALSHAIVDAAVRRWRTLEFVLESVSNHRSHELEPRMRGVLLGGAAQLLLLDRVPPHAVLDESVNWAKKYIRPGAGGMVNAVLRKVALARGGQRPEPWSHHLDAIPLSEGGMLELIGIELPENGRRRLGLACSLPDALLRRWETLYEDPTPPAMHTLCRAPTIICTRYMDAPPVDDDLQPHDSPDHLLFKGARQQLLSLLEANHGIWVQDPASTATLARLELDRAPERVIDLCAGQGTKTRQLRAMYPEASIIACDVDPARLSTLRETYRDEPSVQVMHAEDVPAKYSAWASLVLADAPCSNTGVLARRIEARSRPIEAQLGRLVDAQRSILSAARGLVEPGGTLLYATCSLETEENEENTRWASEQLGLELVDMHRVEPLGQPGDPGSGYRDSSFAARLQTPTN